MLKAMMEYAERQGLSSEPGFASKAVNYALCFAADGRYTSVMPLGDESTKRKVKVFIKAPLLIMGELIGGGGRSHFLFESAKAVCQLSDSDMTEKDIHKHHHFVSLLDKASVVIPELAAVAKTMSDENTIERIIADCHSAKIKPIDCMTIMVAGDFVLDDTRWHPWWRKYRASLSGDPKPAKKGSSGQALCFLSGQPASPCTQPPIKGLSDIGGLATGDKLVCFDKDAFQSYGLGTDGNCLISADSAAAYTTAMNDLIQNRARRLGKTNVKVLYWFKEQIPDEESPLEGLFHNEQTIRAAAEKRMRELLNAFHTGKRPDISRNRYYLATISGCSGRVMVRDWIEGEMPSLLASVVKWCDDFALYDLYGEPVTCPSVAISLGSVMRDAADMPAPWARALWSAAVTGGLIPANLLPMAIKRFMMQLINPSAPEYRGQEFNLDRNALIKAILVRNYEGGDYLMPELNESHPSAAYHAGRAMAIYADLQKAALGDVNAGVVQRFYASASTTPALVLGRLAKMSQFHLNKLDPKLAYWFETRLANVWSAMGDSLPTSLSLEQQGLFALGYYQQIASKRSKTPEVSEDNNKEQNNE